MSDMFESLDLNMREEADRVNPTKAIMASQMECEKRFEGFVARNPERIDFIADDIRSVADKYAAQYDIPSETIYEATVTHLKEAAVKNAEWDKPWTEEDESKESDEEEKKSEEHEESESEEEKEEHEKESSIKTANIDWEDLGDGFYSGKGPHGEWNIDKQTREDQIGMGLEDYDGMTDYRKTRYQLAHIPHGYYEGTGNLSHDVRDVHDNLQDAFEAAQRYQSDWNDRDARRSSTKESVDYMGNDSELEAIQEHFYSLKPRLEALLQLEDSEDYEELESEIWYLKNELDGIDGNEEGSERYWVVAEEIDDALNSLHNWEEKNNYFDKHASAEDKALVEFLNIHEAAWPEWMRPEKGKNESWQRILRRTNRPGMNNPFGRKRKPSGEQVGEQVSDATSPMVDDGSEQPTIQMQRIENDPERMVVNPGDEDFESLQKAEERQRAMNEKARQMEQIVQEEKGRKKNFLPGAMASVKSPAKKNLVDFYVSRGMPEKTASILVEAMGEMAQLQQKTPGLPVEAENADTLNPDKAIGGKEGEKYKNWDVEDKQKELGLEHQDFTDFGEPVREFIQPGGEAPYSENTKKRIDDANQVKMDSKGVKQEDNAPKKSSASVKEASGYVYEVAGHEVMLESHGNFYSVHIELEDGSEVEIGEIMEGPDGWTADSGIGPGENFLHAEDAMEYLINSSPWVDEGRVSKTLDFNTIDSKVEELMKQGMTPEQAIQSLGVYNEDKPKGWGGSKTDTI